MVANEWQPFETMPDHDTPVAITDGAHFFGGIGKRSDLWLIHQSGVGEWQPTHWMPLPDPPSEQ